MAISSIGVGSGLPLDQLLSDLQAAERQSLTTITARTNLAKTRLSAYGTIKSTLEGLKTAAEKLGKAETYGALKTTVGGDAFTAGATSKAIAGEYAIHVKDLAAAQSLKSANGVTDRTAALATGTGTVTVSVELENGTITELELNAADTSLEGIVKAFNNNSDVGVNATMVNTGAASNGNLLLLNARGTGSQAAVKSITINSDTADTTELAKVLTYSAAGGATDGMDEAVAAKNALVSINGIDISSQTNTVKDAIEGVTLTLSKETDTTQNLSVTRDDSVTEKAITEFVNAYNTLQKTIKTLTSYNTETQTGSALSGDSLARRVQSQMRESINFATGSGNLRTLSQLGITTDYKTGTLEIDSTKLKDALKDNMIDVQALFSGENALSTRVSKAADVFVKAGGLISNATDGVNSSIKDLEKQYESATERIDSKMEIYRKQFTQLDSLMAQMNATGSYLTQQLSALSGLFEQKSK